MNDGGPPRFRGVFRRDDDARALYSETAGIHRIMPHAVAVPADADDLAALLDWARSEGAMLIPRGSGSSMAGAAIGPGVIVDLSRWHDVDLARIEENRVTVGPGDICKTVDNAARDHGRRFPVTPSSAAFCTIGGMTATNAAGAHSLAYGTMRKWVTGVECLFADGSRHWIRRGERSSAAPFAAIDAHLAEKNARNGFASAIHAGVRKESSGYATALYAHSSNPIDLLVGSEGTLAFFTRIELAVTPLPGAENCVMGVFPSLEAATEAAISAREAGAVACELLDRTFLEFVNSASGKPADPTTEAILLVDVEGESADAVRHAGESVAASFKRAGAGQTRVAASDDEREALWALRHAASPMLNKLDPRLKSMQIVEDGAVPPERLGDYVRGVRAALDRAKTRGVIFGHAGDANVHVNALVDVMAEGWHLRLDGLVDDITGLVASLGGTISGEHGDGRLRTPLLDRVWTADSRAAFASVKAAFDPTGLLNRGVKVAADATCWPIRYDPTIAALPDRVSEALKVMERDRAYSTFRLDLIE